MFNSLVIKFYTDLNAKRANKLREALENFEKDSSKLKRLHSHTCKTCFYLRESFGVEAMTRYTCLSCSQSFSFNSTNVPSICTNCSQKHKSCVKCMGEIES